MHHDDDDWDDSEFDSEVENDDDEIELISKSQLKREAHALKKLGEKLVGLGSSQLAQVPMPEPLANAVAEARRIKAHGGRKRQIQYIGKLMRGLDAEPIIAALDKLEGNDAAAIHQQHLCEQWRDRLIEEGDAGVGALADEYPQADRQTLRNLVRNAKKEREQNKPPVSYRKLFKAIRDLVEE